MRYDQREDVKTRECVDEKALAEFLAEHPKLWAVRLWNDDTSPMQFIVELLRRFFNKNESDAVKIMLAIHRGLNGVVGVYPRDIAEAKITRARDMADKHNYPTRLTMEPES